MTFKNLMSKYLGRSGLWRPPCRARGRSTLRVLVTVESCRQAFNRDEVMIVPKAGKGNTWVEAKSVKLLPVPMVNLY